MNIDIQAFIKARRRILVDWKHNNMRVYRRTIPHYGVCGCIAWRLAGSSTRDSVLNILNVAINKAGGGLHTDHLFTSIGFTDRAFTKRHAHQMVERMDKWLNKYHYGAGFAAFRAMTFKQKRLK